MTIPDQAAFWDERYGSEDFAFGTAPNAFLAAQTRYLTPGKRAFVPGDGEGRNGVWLAKQGLFVDTVDISPKGVEKARAFAHANGVTINARVADLATWDWPRESYDVAAALYLHFLDGDRPSMHREMMRTLKPGGVLILEAFSLQQIEMQKLHQSGGPKIPDMLYSADKLKSDFAGDTIHFLEEMAVDLDEGHRHRGHAAIVRALVERK